MRLGNKYKYTCKVWNKDQIIDLPTHSKYNTVCKTKLKIWRLYEVKNDISQVQNMQNRKLVVYRSEITGILRNESTVVQTERWEVGAWTGSIWLMIAIIGKLL